MHGFDLKNKGILCKMRDAKDFQFNLAVSRALLSGDGAIVKRFFQQLAMTLTDDVYTRQEVFQSFFNRAKIENAFVYAGFTKLIVDGIVRLVVSGGYDVEGEKESDVELIKEILKKNNFADLWAKGEALQSGLGDFAFKWSIDPEVLDVPVLELIAPEKIELIRKRQRIIGYILKDRVKHGDKEYELREIYRKRDGFVWLVYEIIQIDGNKDKVEIAFYSEEANIIKRLFGIEEADEQTNTGLTEYPVIFKTNTGTDDWISDSGRGISDIYGFHTLESALSEIMSNMVDEIRKGAMKLVISDKLVKHNANGEPIGYDEFDKTIVSVLGEGIENPEKLLQAFNPTINSEKYLTASHEIKANMCNKAGISPLTVGVTGLESIVASAESQQEREGKTSIRKRAAKLIDWADCLKKVFEVGLQMHDKQKGQNIGDYDLQVSFGEYSVPSQEEIIRTLGTGVLNGIYDLKTAIAEYFGDTKTPEEINEIYTRVKVEKGMSLTQEEMTAINGTVRPQVIVDEVV